MRCTLTKKNSTKAERVFAEVLKTLKIPFRHRILIGNREVDFLLPNNVCVEIDGHNQDWEKNEMLCKKGYQPIHLTNKEVLTNDNLKDYVNKLI